MGTKVSVDKSACDKTFPCDFLNLSKFLSKFLKITGPYNIVDIFDGLPLGLSRASSGADVGWKAVVVYIDIQLLGTQVCG